MPENVRDILRRVASNPEELELLREDPEALGERLGLDDDQIEALLASDHLLVSRRRNPLVSAASTTITVGTTTITADPGPTTLDDLDHERLMEVTHRMVRDPEYAERVRRFLDG